MDVIVKTNLAQSIRMVETLQRLIDPTTRGVLRAHYFWRDGENVERRTIVGLDSCYVVSIFMLKV
jgi:hypothetical protein